MPITPVTILALDPGLRECGVAVFVQDQLQYYAIRSLPRNLSADELCTKSSLLLSELIDEFYPNNLILFRHRARTPLQETVTHVLRLTALSRGLKVREYRLAEIKQTLCPSGKAGKRQIAERLVMLFPVLRHEADPQTRGQQVYRQRLFDAIAAGFTHLRRRR